VGDRAVEAVVSDLLPAGFTDGVVRSALVVTMLNNTGLVTSRILMDYQVG
jgi:hypothetical protein